MLAQGQESLKQGKFCFITRMLQETSPSGFRNLKFISLPKNEILLPIEVMRTVNLGLRWKAATNEESNKDNCDPESIKKLQSS